MTDANKNLVLRIVSALVLLPVVVGLLWGGPGWTAGLIAVASAILAWEFFTITLKKLDLAQLLGIAVAGAFPIILVVAPERSSTLVTAVAAGLLIATFTHYLLRGPLPEAPMRASLVITGTLYAGLLSTVGGLRALPDGLYWIILTLAATWMNDTGGYFAGRLFGKHKLYPAVSPGKTWEGFAGGVLGSVIGGFVVRALFLPQLSAVDVLLVTLPVSVLGPLGDLCESMLKRAYGVKDSGKIIPGHGGLLDRVDALLFTAPYVYLFALLRG